MKFLHTFLDDLFVAEGCCFEGDAWQVCPQRCICIQGVSLGGLRAICTRCNCSQLLILGTIKKLPPPFFTLSDERVVDRVLVGSINSIHGVVAPVHYNRLF